MLSDKQKCRAANRTMQRNELKMPGDELKMLSDRSEERQV